MKFNMHPAFFAVLLLTVALLAAPGCGKGDDDDDQAPACNLTNADLTYTKNMKSLIDRVCLSCHGGNGPGPVSYTTYEGIKPLLDNGKVLERVVVKKDMPQTALTMTQAQRDSVNCWIKAGYPK